MKLIAFTLFYNDRIPKSPQNIEGTFTIYVPLNRIAYIVPRDRGNPHAGFQAYIKLEDFLGPNHNFKSVNPALISIEEFEIINSK